MEFLFQLYTNIFGPSYEPEDSKASNEVQNKVINNMEPYCNKTTNFKKQCAPDGYLEKLHKFLENNISDDSNEMSFTILEPYHRQIMVDCEYFYFLNDDLDIMLKDFENKYNCSGSGSDTDSGSDDEVNERIKSIKKILSNTSYFETKKGVFIFLTSFGSEMHLFIDDIGMKFRFEMTSNGKVFDTREFSL